MKHLQRVRAVIIRKVQGLIGCKIGDIGSGPPAYLLEIKVVETGQTQTIHLDLSRSRDFYRLPVNRPLILEIGRHTTRVGRWLSAWSEDEPEVHDHA